MTKGQHIEDQTAMNSTLNDVEEQKSRAGDMVRIISHCMEGRFKPGETSRTCAAVLRSLLDYCDVFIGQTAQFQPLAVELPDNFNFIGEPSAFILYDSAKFSAVEHLWSPQNNLEGEVKHAVCKLRSKTDPQLEFFALSWFVKETYLNYNGARKCCLLFRQLVQLVQLLGRETPVLVGGNYQLLPEEAEFLISREEFYNFSGVDLYCLTYKPLTVRKQVRTCGFFLCGNKFLDPSDDNLVGTRSIKGNIILNGCRNEFWRNPEDSFYWDPMTLDLSGEKLIETINNCNASNKNATTTPSPVSSSSFHESDDTSLHSEPQDGDIRCIDHCSARGADNFNSLLASSKLQHLDLADYRAQQHYQQMKLNTQREKLQELRTFLECLELRMDAERASASFANPLNYKPYDQRTVVLRSDNCQDEVAKSLSTICEYEEHNLSPAASLGEDESGTFHDFHEEDSNQENERGSVVDMRKNKISVIDDGNIAPKNSIDRGFNDSEILTNINDISTVKQQLYCKDDRYVEGATDDDTGDPKELPTPKGRGEVEGAADGSCTVM